MKKWSSTKSAITQSKWWLVICFFFLFSWIFWKCWRILVCSKWIESRIVTTFRRLSFFFLNAGYWLFVLAMRVSWSRFNIPRLFTVCYMTKHFVFSGIEFFIPRYEETDKLRTFFKVAWPSSVARLFCSGHSNFHVGEFCFFFLVLILVVHSEILSSLNSILLRENFHFVSFICFRR